MKICVTGGNGFIGSWTVRKLVAGGHSVRCLLRPTSRTERIDDLPFERAVGDVCEIATLRAAMSGCDATIHLAAPGGWEADKPSTLRAVIEGGTANVLAVAESLPAHRVIVVSSTAAVNASDSPYVFDETSEFTIRDDALVYAFAKHRAEALTLDACARGVDAVIVNPAEVYGPRDTALCTASNLIDLATSTPVLVCRGGTSVVHVEDVAAGIVAALARGRAGERYILGGDNLEIRQIAELVLELTGRRAPIVAVPNTVARTLARAAMRTRVPLPFNPYVALYATRYWFVDNAKARRELGVSFRGARSTLSDTIDWLRSSGRLGR